MSYEKVLKFYKENICSLKYITAMTCFFKINRGTKSPMIQLDFISGWPVISDQWYKCYGSGSPGSLPPSAHPSPPHTHTHTHTDSYLQYTFLQCNISFQLIVKVMGQLYLQKKVKRQFAYWC